MAGEATCLTLYFSRPALRSSAPASSTPLSVTGSSEGGTMILDYILGGLVTVFLLAYLAVALTRPERF
jgi:K+-transporting ATPase KdpF subunit